MTTSDSRPWGRLETLKEDAEHKVKRLVINHAERTSLHCHKYRREALTVVRGHAQILVQGTEFSVLPGQTCYIGIGDLHRIKNIGYGVLILVEVQIGKGCSEEDIFRFHDDYGRHTISQARAGNLIGAARQFQGNPTVG